MTARCSIRRKRSISEGRCRSAKHKRGELQCYHMFDSRLDAWYSDLSALSQRRIICPEACLRTLGHLLFAMQVEGATAPTTALSGSFLDLIKKSSPISQFVLAVLVIFSIVSWGIILYKLWAFNRIQAQSSRFIEIFRRSTKFSEVQGVCQSLSDSPLVGIFLAGHAELNLQLRHASGGANSAATAVATGSRPVLKSLVSVDRALMRASNVE